MENEAVPIDDGHEGHAGGGAQACEATQRLLPRSPSSGGGYKRRSGRIDTIERIVPVVRLATMRANTACFMSTIAFTAGLGSLVA